MSEAATVHGDASSGTDMCSRICLIAYDTEPGTELEGVQALLVALPEKHAYGRAPTHQICSPG
jgi:hypothetical protein